MLNLSWISLSHAVLIFTLRSFGFHPISLCECVCKYASQSLRSMCPLDGCLFFHFYSKNRAFSHFNWFFPNREFLVMCCVHESVDHCVDRRSFFMPMNTSSNTIFENWSIEQSKSIINDNHILHWLFVNRNECITHLCSCVRLLALTHFSFDTKNIFFIQCTSTLNSLYKHVKQFFFNSIVLSACVVP